MPDKPTPKPHYGGPHPSFFPILIQYDTGEYHVMLKPHDTVAGKPFKVLATSIRVGSYVDVTV